MVCRGVLWSLGCGAFEFCQSRAGCLGGLLALPRRPRFVFLDALSARDLAPSQPSPTGLLTARVDETVVRLPRGSVPFFTRRSFAPGIARSFPVRPVSAEPRALAATCPLGHPSVRSHPDRRHVYFVDSLFSVHGKAMFTSVRTLTRNQTPSLSLWSCDRTIRPNG